MLGRGVRGPAGLFHLLFGRPGPEIAPKKPYFAMSISVDIAHSMSLDISVDIDVDDMSTPDMLRVNPEAGSSSLARSTDRREAIKPSFRVATTPN